MIQRRILDALATEMLAGRVREGDRVRVDVDARRPEQLKFAVATPRP